MTFKEALEKLDIEDYAERIFNSNSHGELAHVYDYISVAESCDEVSWFREWFKEVVMFAENNWNRPESVFQHIPKILKESIIENKG